MLNVTGRQRKAVPPGPAVRGSHRETKSTLSLRSGFLKSDPAYEFAFLPSQIYLIIGPQPLNYNMAFSCQPSYTHQHPVLVGIDMVGNLFERALTVSIEIMPNISGCNSYLGDHMLTLPQVFPLIITATKRTDRYVIVQTIYVVVKTYGAFPDKLRIIDGSGDTPHSPIPQHSPYNQYGYNREQNIEEYQCRYIYPYHNITI